MKKRKHNLTPEQLEEIALSDSITLINASPKQIVEGFIKEFRINRGENKVRAGELYSQFNRWSENRRVELVPSIQLFGQVMVEQFDVRRDSNGKWYSLNQSIEQVRVEREKKERSEAKQAKKEPKKNKQET